MPDRRSRRCSNQDKLGMRGEGDTLGVIVESALDYFLDSSKSCSMLGPAEGV